MEYTKFYFAIFINMENTENMQLETQTQEVLDDATLMAFIEDSTCVECFNEQLANFITTL